MKKAILSILLLLVYSSCYKANRNMRFPDTVPKFTFTTYGNDIDYTSGNIRDSILTFTIYDSTGFNLTMNYTLLSGNPENYPVTCFVSGLPAGISVRQDSFVFRLNYKHIFNFSAELDTGTYSAFINIITADSTLKFPFRIRVIPQIDWTINWAGKYSGSDPCNGGLTWHTYEAVVSNIPGTWHWLGIKNFRGLGDTVVVGMNMWGSGSVLGVTIPLQTIYGYTIYGEGHTMANKIVINDTIIIAGDTQFCYTQLTPHE